ncbi:hypothetical protein [Candidatus Nitronereus thalassa]|uniref:Uncharacterized protein n=1 Tax=Candidatus Nitronereus thalassa TaxID=3020898 RepID=A0ABU3K5G7_9BACT|nr:hypothetical protein [Candidatus Nitronereus thalassa]MDT7041623.1 hypothetical protein [Candidatus Nitronereus thalassa]
MFRLIPIFFGLLLPLFLLLPNLSWAQVTVDFTPSVSANLGAPDGEEEIQRMINEGLQKMGRTNPAALALYNSRQTLRIICYGSYEADQLGVEKPEAELFTQSWGETHGDFNDDGTPKAGGTTHIVLDCDKLKQYRWYDTWEFMGVTQSNWDILVHEVLHATHRERRHPPDTLDMYEDWVTAFNQSIATLLRTTMRESEERGYFRMPDWWVEELKKALKEEFERQRAAQAQGGQGTGAVTPGGGGSTTPPSTNQPGQGGTPENQGSGSQGGSGSQESDSSSSGTNQRTSQSSTLQGTYQTKPGTALADSKAGLPTVYTGTWYDAFFSPESFLAESTPGETSKWNPGDQSPGFVGMGLGGGRLQDLQVTIEVRFITLKDSFFEKIGVDFDFDISDQNADQLGRAGQVNPVLDNSWSSGTKDLRYIGIGDSFFDRVGVDFDLNFEDEIGRVPTLTAEDQIGVSIEGQFYQGLEDFRYEAGVGYGYDVGLVDIPFVNFIGRQQIDLGAIVVNDNPSKIFGLNPGTSPWRIAEDTQGAGLDLKGWTHSSMPWGTTLGWQPAGNAGTLDAFTQEFGNVIQYEEANAGISGAPAPLNPDDWPQGPAMPAAHTKIKRAW